jgi:hypothetical protein
MDSWGRPPFFARAGALFESCREIAHAQVAASLHQKATGFTRIGKKVAQSKAGPVVVEVEEYHPPDTAAASFWLRNRAPDYWKERREVNVQGSLEHRFATMTIEERRADARALAEQVRRALLEAASTIDGEAEEIVEPPPP